MLGDPDAGSRRADSNWYFPGLRSVEIDIVVPNTLVLNQANPCAGVEQSRCNFGGRDEDEISIDDCHFSRVSCLL